MRRQHLAVTIQSVYDGVMLNIKNICSGEQPQKSSASGDAGARKQEADMLCYRQNCRVLDTSNTELTFQAAFLGQLPGRSAKELYRTARPCHRKTLSGTAEGRRARSSSLFMMRAALDSKSPVVDMGQRKKRQHNLVVSVKGLVVLLGRLLQPLQLASHTDKNSAMSDLDALSEHRQSAVIV